MTTVPVGLPVLATDPLIYLSGWGVEEWGESDVLRFKEGLSSGAKLFGTFRLSSFIICGTNDTKF